MSNQFCSTFSARERQLCGLQAAANAVPVRRYSASQSGPDCGCNSCGCNCNNCGCNSCGCGSCCDNGGGNGGAQPIGAWYFGHPAQTVGFEEDLIFSRYSPADDAEAGTTARLPRGRYLISYSVNASAALTDPATPVPTTVTVGVAPRINGVAFPRGGSFATIPFGVDTFSTTLSSTFIVTLPEAVNTVGFRSTSEEPFETTFELFNVTIVRLD